jgi:hypothetical protein
MEENKILKKKIVCLFGAAKHGKTATIKYLADILIPTPTAPTVIWYQPNPRTISSRRAPISSWKGDICASTDCGRKRIGLNSGGDVPAQIKSHLTKLAAENCDIIFCAIRTMGETATEVVNIARDKHYTIIWTHPYTLGEFVGNRKAVYDILNKKKANHLKDFI